MIESSVLLIILVVLFFFSAMFSAAESALIALNKIRLRHMMEKKKKGATRIYKQVARMDKLIATMLIGNNFVNTAIASIATYLFTVWWGPETGLIVATFAMTLFLIIFGDLLPKTMATSHPEAVSFFFRYFVSFFIFVFHPLSRLLTWISNGFIRFMGGNPHYRSPLATEEEMKMMITIGKEEGFYGDDERKMLERIFHFDEIEVRDVMTPLDQVAAVEIDMPQDEIERVFLEEGHNRIPVYRATKANIVGIVYVRDLLYLFKHTSLIHLGDLVSAPYFVPPHQKAAELLKEFQRKKLQIAIVRDIVTGKALGLVTLEDLLEEIVGEIEEEIDASLTK